MENGFVLNDRYRIVCQLGSGGFGAVYEAEDRVLECTVAIKESTKVEDNLREAFMREASLLANLRHPALPHIKDRFFTNDRQYLVMQLIDGQDLSELLKEQGRPFTFDEIHPWVETLLEALEYLHGKKVVHRDIKPANIKLTPNRHLFLLDFGLAKGVTGLMGAESDKSLYAYTKHFAPLEQLTGTGTDQRSDLYSLAATILNLLTGRLPPDAMTRFNAQRDRLPDPIVAMMPGGLNPGVTGVLLRALAVERNERLNSAAEMHEQLRAAIAASTEPTLPNNAPITGGRNSGMNDPNYKNGGTTVPMNPPPPVKKRRKWLWKFAAFVIVLLLGFAGGIALMLRFFPNALSPASNQNANQPGGVAATPSPGTAPNQVPGTAPVANASPVPSTSPVVTPPDPPMPMVSAVDQVNPEFTRIARYSAGVGWRVVRVERYPDKLRLIIEIKNVDDNGRDQRFSSFSKVNGVPLLLVDDKGGPYKMVESQGPPDVIRVEGGEWVVPSGVSLKVWADFEPLAFGATGGKIQYSENNNAIPAPFKWNDR